MLFYAVCAWEPDFTGYVIDYGTFPDQKRRYFTLRDATKTLLAEVAGAGVEGAVQFIRMVTVKEAICCLNYRARLRGMSSRTARRRCS
jgi:hypothetical protein